MKKFMLAVLMFAPSPAMALTDPIPSVGVCGDFKLMMKQLDTVGFKPMIGYTPNKNPGDTYMFVTYYRQNPEATVTFKVNMVNNTSCAIANGTQIHWFHHF